MSRYSRPLLFAAVLAAWGCGPGRNDPPTASPSGTVTLDGSPLPGASLDFVSADARVSARTDKNGVYELPVVPVGTYKVAVSPMLRPPARMAKGDIGTYQLPTGLPPIPAKYHKPETSGLEVRVELGMPPSAFDLKSK